MIHTVLDTNVIVSAILSSKTDSPPFLIVEQALTEIIVPVFSDLIIAEYLEVLKRKKFKFDKKIVHTFIESIIERGELISTIRSNTVLPDPEDLPFFDAMLTKGLVCDCYLVTGNKKHFPNNPNILSPREMLNLILSINI